MRNIILPLVFLSACSNDQTTGAKPAPQTVIHDLSQKNIKEILDLKYERAILTCRLFFQNDQLETLLQEEKDLDLKKVNGSSHLTLLLRHSLVDVVADLNVSVKKLDRFLLAPYITWTDFSRRLRA